MLTPDDTETNKPNPLLLENSKPAPYPIDALPHTLRDAAKAIAEHIQAPLAIAGQCVIGAAAYFAQSRVNAPHLQRENGMACSLFQLTLADSGDRKSECRRLAFRRIDEAEKQKLTQHYKDCENIKSEAAKKNANDRDKYFAENPLPANPRTQYSDATFERIAGDMIRGTVAAYWDTDEGGQLFGGTSLKAETRASTLGGLIKAFDNGIFDRMRAHGNQEGSGTAYDRRLGIHVLVQPIAIVEALNDPLLRGQGFLPRFLFTCADSLAGTRLLTPEHLQKKPYEDQRLTGYWDLCDEIAKNAVSINTDTGGVAPNVLELSADAKEVWLKFYNGMEGRQCVLGEFEGVRPFASRGGELALRLATIFACFEGYSEINADIMRGACKLVRHSMSEWTRYIEGNRRNLSLEQAAALMEWLLKKAWARFDARELQQKGPSFIRKGKDPRNKLLSILVQHKQLLRIDDNQYQVNPAATAATIATTHVAARENICDTAATNCDRASGAGHLSQPVARRKPSNYGACRGCSKCRKQC